MHIDDNVELTGDGTTRCRHCDAHLGSTDTDPLKLAIHHEREATAAGPGVRVAPAEFTDRPVELRQSFCPQCLTVLATEIVPADELSYRSWSVTR